MAALAAGCAESPTTPPPPAVTSATVPGTTVTLGAGGRAGDTAPPGQSPTSPTRSPDPADTPAPSTAGQPSTTARGGDAATAARIAGVNPLPPGFSDFVGSSGLGSTGPQISLPADRRARIASLMMVGVANYDDALWALNQGAGGIFIGSFTDPALLVEPGRDIAALHRAVGRPFQVAIDAEGGRVSRHPGLVGQLPSARVMAQTMSPQQVEAAAYDLGAKLRSLGITVDFAPVADIDGGPAGRVIGDRSFSPDPVTAGIYAAAFSRGLAAAGVTPVVKHFPGHGRAAGDSHTGQVFTPPAKELADVDLVAFTEPLRVAATGAMIGHMTVPGLGDDGVPATFNPAVYQLLRGGAYRGGAPFDGVIYTDDLSGMKAISDTTPLPEAVLRSLTAGADVALWISTRGLVEAIDHVDRAVAEGRYSEQALNRAAARVAAQRR
ncbi:glycoside hydrolase family 3 N-terminal domain-containing protein [Corynebacterium mendelii]